MNIVEQAHNDDWETVCSTGDLIPNSGICALVQGKQLAIFYLPDETPPVYAVGNWDPIGKANVICRGIVGSIGEELVIASPLYKQHFSLTRGTCLEQPEHTLGSYAVDIIGDTVHLSNWER